MLKPTFLKQIVKAKDTNIPLYKKKKKMYKLHTNFYHFFICIIY